MRSCRSRKNRVVSSSQEKVFVGFNFHTICMCSKYAKNLRAPFKNFLLYGTTCLIILLDDVLVRDKWVWVGVLVRLYDGCACLCDGQLSFVPIPLWLKPCVTTPLYYHGWQKCHYPSYACQVKKACVWWNIWWRGIYQLAAICPTANWDIICNFLVPPSLAYVWALLVNCFSTLLATTHRIPYYYYYPYPWQLIAENSWTPFVPYWDRIAVIPRPTCARHASGPHQRKRAHHHRGNALTKPCIYLHSDGICVYVCVHVSHLD